VAEQSTAGLVSYSRIRMNETWLQERYKRFTPRAIVLMWLVGGIGGAIGAMVPGAVGLVGLSNPPEMSVRATPTLAVADELREAARGTFGVLAPVTDAERADPLAQLGQALFWDKRLSANGEVACASCHAADDWGADRRRFSVDAKDRLTKRHSQTVFNATLQPSLRWVADRKSAIEQAEKSLTGSMGFAQSEDVIGRLQASGYADRFQTVFPHADDPLTPGHYAQAIAAYEQTLRTPSVFDQYLQGESDVLNAQQRRGLQSFLEIGCADCHAGPLLGGEQLQTFGVHRDYWLATGSEQQDAGRFESTQEPGDRNVFRVPLLRNIARTAPYFHDGSVADLEQAVRVMAEVQLGLELTTVQTSDLVAFLESLSGEIPANYQDPHHPQRAEQLEGRVVGFFATNAAGRLTHPGTRLHAHLIYSAATEPLATGHLESFGVQAGAVLRLPRPADPEQKRQAN